MTYQAKKHLELMKRLEADKHKVEEDMYKELEQQKDSDYINHIVSNNKNW